MKYIKQNKLKIGLIVVFSILLIVELIFLLSDKDSKKQVVENKNKTIEFNEENRKYVVDITTPYKLNGLTFSLVKSSENSYYYKIGGLKNKEVENKINEKIREKIEKLENRYKEEYEKFVVYNGVNGNFENVLSIGFYVDDNKTISEVDWEYSDAFSYPYDMKDFLNIDLNTGEELDLADIVVTDSNLRDVLISEVAESYYTSNGFYQINPDYSKIEDVIYSVMKQYNKGNYAFVFTPTHLYFKFSDIYFPYPMTYYGEEDEIDEDLTGCERTPEEWGGYFLCKDYYSTEEIFSIPLVDLMDDLILYDKFKTTDSLFENEQKEVWRKFLDVTRFENDDYERNRNIFILSENSFIDYMINYADEEDLWTTIKNQVLKESSILMKKGSFNLMAITGFFEPLGSNDYDYSNKYNYIYYNVSTYSMDKNIFNNYKKDIYLNKINFNGWYYESTAKNRYDFLKQYHYKDGYFFYIYDNDGKELAVTDVLSDDFPFEEYIPQEWLSLGKYKTVEEMINDCYIMVDESMEFPDRLVILDENNSITLKYKGRKKVLVSDDYDEYHALENLMYN